MEVDDPTVPLLGERPPGRLRKAATKLCSLESWRRRLPVTIWLPKYNLEYLIRDIIAGITVGLTSIPQGIAYAMVAGLPPQVGLYSSIFPGIMYSLFGSCKDVTVGPTAILSALLAKYVAKSADFAYLASFLSGCVILLLGILQLGFLLDFISKPVISGFTTAAAMQISASQLKSLFRIKGSSGDTFIHAIINFFKNIKTVHLWDTLLGIVTIIALVLLKRATIPVTETSSRTRVYISKTWLYVIRARNALVVFIGAVLAYILCRSDLTPIALTGKIEGGLPHFGPPPFNTIVKNHTLDFEDMLSIYGPEGLVMPLVAILESIAIAKAFAGGKSVDGTQEMIAVGACNIVSSFAQSMPATGSFTRTALNHASGVVTPAGSFFKACLVLLSVTLLADAFYFIPRATLAGIIIVAMFSIMELSIVRSLWRNSKLELLVYLVTVVMGACVGLEYGILCGALADVARALAYSARPALISNCFKIGNQDCIFITLFGKLTYSCCEHVPRVVRRNVLPHTRVVVLDARQLISLDFGVAENLISVILDLEKAHHTFLLWNFKESHKQLYEDLHPGFSTRFVKGPSIDQHILKEVTCAWRRVATSTVGLTRHRWFTLHKIIACLVLLSVTLLADAFYFIPRATLAGIIIVAMFSIMELSIVRSLWRNSKLELLVYLVIVVMGACVGLEYGILCGALADVARALAYSARPALISNCFKIGNQDCIFITLFGKLTYSCCEHVPRVVRRNVLPHTRVVVLDARQLISLDFGVAENLISVILDLEKAHHTFLLWNFKESHKQLYEDLHPGFSTRFVKGPSIDQHILSLEPNG